MCMDMCADIGEDMGVGVRMNMGMGVGILVMAHRHISSYDA